MGLFIHWVCNICVCKCVCVCICASVGLQATVSVVMVGWCVGVLRVIFGILNTCCGSDSTGGGVSSDSSGCTGRICHICACVRIVPYAYA